MASNTQRYPLSTPDGTAIPLDIMKPHSFIKKAFTGVVSGDIAVPDGIEIMSIITTTDCILHFGGNAVVPVDGVAYADSIYVDAGVRVCVAPKAATFTIIQAAFPGTAVIQFIEKWAGLALSKQLSGR